MSFQDEGSGFILSDSDRTATRIANAGYRAVVRSSVSTTGAGKYYGEITIIALPDATLKYPSVGISAVTATPSITADSVNDAPGRFTGGCTADYGYFGSVARIYHNDIYAAFGDYFTTGDIIGVALDLNTGELWFSKNGVWQGSGDPDAGLTPAFTGITGDQYIAGAVAIENDVLSIATTDIELTYTPPTGFSAWESTLKNIDSIAAEFSISNDVISFKESFQTLNLALLLGNSVDVESGTQVNAEASFGLGSEVYTYSQGKVDLFAGFAISSRADIGIQSYADPNVSFGINSSIDAFGDKPLSALSSFALSSDVEVTLRGEPIRDIDALFSLSTNISAQTISNVIPAIFGLSAVLDINSDNEAVTSAGFVISSHVDSFMTNKLSVSGSFSISPAITATHNIYCSLPTHDSGRWT